MTALIELIAKPAAWRFYAFSVIVVVAFALSVLGPSENSGRENRSDLPQIAKDLIVVLWREFLAT